MSNLYECPEHKTAFHLAAEPCWPCYLRAMYGGSPAGTVHPLPSEHVFWTGLEKARRTWRPVAQEALMATDLETLRLFLRQVEQWPPEDRADLGRVAEILEAAHPTLYAALIEYLEHAPMSLVHPYAEAVLNVPSEHRAWFRLLVMELRERSQRNKA
jgi:hypothetical protein